MWIRDYHIDGLRLDAVHAIVDDSPLNILEQLATEAHAASATLHRSVLLFAETDANDPRLVRARDAAGYGLDAAWADDWHHALHVVLTGERTGYYEDFTSPGMLAKALRQAWVYDGVWSHHRQRMRGAKPAGVPPNAFVVAAQNHDQVGNRAAGHRLAALVDEGRVKAAAALLLTTPFTPLLFQGEEWAARVRRFRLEPRRGAGPARTRHLRAVEAEMGRTGRALPSTHARLVPRLDRDATPHARGCAGSQGARRWRPNRL